MRRSAPTRAGAAAVWPYYNDYYNTPQSSREGSKQGTTVTEAVLAGFPGSPTEHQFQFETVARGAHTGSVYASLARGFTVAEAALSSVTNEHAAVQQVQSRTSDTAVARFDAFYRNPGAPTAPRR